jgi:hypothetical protein
MIKNDFFAGFALFFKIINHTFNLKRRFKMRHFKAILCALVMLFPALTELNAQEAVSTAGGEAIGSGGSLSYSVGQLFYHSEEGTNGSIVQGVQQPLEISFAVGIEKNSGISLKCSAYPNPTGETLNLKVENFDKQVLQYKLYNAKGELLINKKLESMETSIRMDQLLPSTYFLKVIQSMNAESEVEIVVFKIIKK